MSDGRSGEQALAVEQGSERDHAEAAAGALEKGAARRGPGVETAGAGAGVHGFEVSLLIRMLAHIISSLPVAPSTARCQAAIPRVRRLAKLKTDLTPYLPDQSSSRRVCVH
jgi:hypothetical protein